MKRWIGTIAIGGIAWFLAASLGAAVPQRTIVDLKAAYKGETTAQQKYTAYARLADRDGCPNVARLFRAAAQAESVHARNHKDVLKSLGVAAPQAGAYAARPAAGKDRTAALRTALQDSVRGETYERDTMYPRMIREARGEAQGSAVQSMSYALQAETQHAALFTTALKTLQSPTQATTSYSVCPVCGATFTGPAPANCPVCGTRRALFKTIR